jgi:kinesin family protein 3/17
VVVRCRPLFGKEVNEGRAAIVRCDGAAGSISISNPSSSASEPPKQFTFDSVYDHTNTQRAIYEETALPIVRAAMEGYNGTVFCYGQTGTGKTHTMEGSSACSR